jgi:hypothetical protein
MEAEHQARYNFGKAKLGFRLKSPSFRDFFYYPNRFLVFHGTRASSCGSQPGFLCSLFKGLIDFEAQVFLKN